MDNDDKNAATGHDENSNGFFSGEHVLPEDMPVSPEYFEPGEEPGEPAHKTVENTKQQDTETSGNTSVAPEKTGMSKMKRNALIGGGVAVLFGGILLFGAQQQPGPSNFDAPQGEQQKAQTQANDVSLAPSNTPRQAPAAQLTAVQPVPPATETAIAPAASAVPAASAAMSTASAPAADTRYDSLEARVARIENYLSKAATPAVSEKKKDAAPRVTAKRKRETREAKTVSSGKPGVLSQRAAQPVSRVDETVQVVSLSEIEAAQKPVQPACKYRAALNNRAWVTCGDDLYSVKRGDVLPQPYGVVTDVNDAAGNVATSGGLIQ